MSCHVTCVLGSVPFSALWELHCASIWYLVLLALAWRNSELASALAVWLHSLNITRGEWLLSCSLDCGGANRPESLGPVTSAFSALCSAFCPGSGAWDSSPLKLSKQCCHLVRWHALSFLVWSERTGSFHSGLSFCCCASGSDMAHVKRERSQRKHKSWCSHLTIL